MKPYKHPPSPYHDFGHKISTREMYLDMNKVILSKRKFEKSASMRSSKTPSRYNVDSMLSDLPTDNLTKLNGQVMDSYKVELAHNMRVRDRELFRTRS